MSATKFKPVNARPVKRFFVEMLTRDIALEDAILDLLDNCVDGILRSVGDADDSEQPYKGHWAKITFNKKEFVIEDNCGGIPWSLHDQAFRMGRPPDGHNGGEGSLLTVGVYGIGMKRALFKLGRSATIWTQNKKDNYEVSIPNGWMDDPEDWDLDVTPAKAKRSEDGTRIVAKDLEDGIKERFTAESFKDELLDKIESHYSVIIHKGFEVTVNETPAKAKPLSFRFASSDVPDADVRPYIFRANPDGIEVFLAIGLRDPIPGVEKTLSGQTETEFSSDYAGWTVICNDRVVLYCNRDELTGWGTAKLPRYHTQFISISGVVEFKGPPALLPTTTTKRGLDFSSPLYQKVLDRMRDGLRLFVDFTNRWKAREEEAKEYVGPVASLSYDSLKREASKLSYAKVKVGLEGEQYKPKLPRPVDDSPDVRISYFRDKEKVAALAELILPDLAELRDRDIRRGVGEKSFDYALDELGAVRRPKKSK